MKRVLALALCVALLIGLLPFGATAKEIEKQHFSLRDTVIEQAGDSYYLSRATAGKTSFHGKCGLMVSHQMYNLGINKRCIVFDGNDQYDYYASREKTSGGYYITAYPAASYNLEEALMAVTSDGTRDVMNILVGFQWTNTEAGAKYGHAMFINGIVGGTVYFVESFGSTTLGGAEGTVLSCSIADFADYYDKWTIFEGVVHFGTGAYHDVCPNVPTDITVQTRFATILRSEPAVVGRQGCVRLRNIAAGERLRVTGIYEAEDTYYYRVETNEGYGFITAGATSPVQVNSEGVFLSGFALPSYMRLGDTAAFAGAVADSYGSLSSVEVCVTNPQGQLVRRELAEEQGSTVQLHDLQEGLYFELLEPGTYQVEIYAGRTCMAVSGGNIVTYDLRVRLGSRTIQVGGNPKERAAILQQEQTPPEGWFREQGAWYCYEEGKPVTGWVTHLGVKYYLQPDGAVTTGAQSVDGKELYFSATGALITGWLTLEGKTGYRAADGVAVTGWQTIDGNLYCFGEDGVMLTNTEQVKDNVTYQIAKDGTAKQIEKQEIQNG